MPLLDLNSVRVNFPFEPYPCQVDYMEKVLECLKKDVNGILESPTGTGKTLCLLCSSLAWQESRKAQTEFNRQVSASSLLGAEDVNGILESPTGTGKTLCLLCSSLAWQESRKAQTEFNRQDINGILESPTGTGKTLCLLCSSLAWQESRKAQTEFNRQVSASSLLGAEDVNGILESPTGTGKTLCLLCSSLAWQESRKAQTEFNRQVSASSLLGAEASNTLSEQSLNNLAKSLESSTGTSWGGSQFAVPKIIYASRTHSQLSQVVQELKRTAYNSVKVSVIGSRDQLCIHEQVKKEQNNTNKVHLCRAKVNNRTCYYYNHLDNLKNNSEPRVLMGNVVDIEDLVNYGHKNKVCPYYMARELRSDADIIFMPYNYLLDAKTRKAHGVELQGNIVIFDEAHNLEKICEESASFDLKPGDLATAMEELTKVAEKMLEMIEGETVNEDDYADGSAPAPDFNLDDILRLKSTLKDLEDQIDLIDVPNNGKGSTKPGLFMFDLLSKANIAFGNKAVIIDTLDKIIGYVNQDGSPVGVTRGAGLTKVADMLKIVFSQDVTAGKSLIEHQEKLARSYKVHIQQDDNSKKKKTMDLWTNSGKAEKSGKTLSYWCFSPGHSMQELIAHGIKCIILTSGTLSPLSSFTAEMQISFPVQLENPHVIQKHQVCVGTLKKGPDGTTLNSNYETRFTPAYQSSLGNCIVNFARVVPNGLLIFFPSYPVMEKCLEHWKENNIWSRIEQYKQIFVESKMKGVLNDMMNDFYEKINNPALNGAIFIAVCRGKVSEGLDFSDNNGRAVVITGLPYPPYMDPKVVLKMQYLDEMKGKQGFQSLSGKDWYKQQASRAVNQAIGRVIRHKDDFGAILLCDTRFSAPDAIKQLPVWVRPHVNKYDNFGQVVKDTMVFFKHAEKMMPAPKPSKKTSHAGTSAGAYFMPTTTRHSSSTDHVTPSHMVANHVPSLKHRVEQVNLHQLKEDYKGGTAHRTTNSRDGLFSALDHTERQFQLSDTQVPSYQTGSSGDTTMRKPTNKKKIIIKRKNSEVSPDDKSTEVSNKVSITHVNTAENYIAEVKSTLPVESYKRFSKALFDYKKTEDLGKVCEILADLFTEDDSKKHLFAKFYKFVRAKHKKEFHDLCEQLTGLQTEYKAEDSVNKKRLQDTSHQDQLAKKQKVDNSGLQSDMKNSKDTDKSSSTNGQVLTNHSQSSSLNVQTVLKSSPVIDNTDNMGKGAQKSVTKGSSSGVKCCMCKEEAKIPFRSLCDHICCMNCWRKVFETNKLCPQCQAGVRRRHLVQIYFKMEEEETT